MTNSKFHSAYWRNSWKISGSIFESFTQEEQGYSRKFEGNGLLFGNCKWLMVIIVVAVIIGYWLMVNG